MVAVDGCSHGQVGNGAALGGLAGAVSANGVAQDAGGPGRAAVFIDSSHIDSVGQSLGKRRADMAVHYSKRTQQLGMIVSAMIAIVVFFFNKEIIGLYNDDMAIISLGGPLLQMVALIQPLQAAQFISAGVLRGAGDTKYTAYVSSATVMILRPVLAIILISFFGMGLEGAWYALVADQLLRTVLILARYYSGKWRNVMSKHDAGKLA